MKKRILILLLALMTAAASAALAAPALDGVFAGDSALVSGQDGWYFDFTASEGGTLALQLLSGETGEAVADIGSIQVEAGPGRMAWDGLLPDGSAPASGAYMLAAQLKNFWGEESNQSTMSLHIFASEAERGENTLDLSLFMEEEATFWEEGMDALAAAAEAEAAQYAGVPQAGSFWEMNPDDYDLDNPEHQMAIWEIMMQPITVLEGDQTENIYITNQPGISPRPYKENCAGEFHGQSQGVNVLATEGEYALIEAYTNDGTKTDSSYMESIAATKIRGYVKESLLFTVTPSDKYAILVDKLRQRMYVFEDGKIISELLVSTGLNNPKQPYNETPAGEFLVVSWTGDFKAGSRTIDRKSVV